MKRILIWRSLVKGSDMDFFSNTDYSDFAKVINKRGYCQNWGNKLWFQAICTEINGPENELFFRSNDSVEQINEKYDLIVYPMANFFSVEHINSMEQLSGLFNQIKIPVYIVACGAQATSYDDIHNLIRQIGEPAKKFIGAIYNTGGEFALRGYFTKDFFDLLGFPSAVVTGCPSMYQHGKDYFISNNKLPMTQLLPVVNGHMRVFDQIWNHFPKTVYIDQDAYWDKLYDSDYTPSKSLKAMAREGYLNGLNAPRLFADGRVRMFADINDWYWFLKDNGFNYSIGSRIHGNIMAILSGIPATVLAMCRMSS